MKNKIFILGLFLVVISLSSNVKAAEENYDFYYQDFLISAYYSPLPNQSRYIRGSYEADIKLNGRGTNAADGTEVFMGLLAAPKSYAFGTNIELPGLGIGEVHDRGGAIVAMKNYHRIDVWMGQGEEGLSRALNWGMRHVTGKVYFSPKSQAISLDYTTIPATLPAIAKKSSPPPPSLFLGKLQYGEINNNVIKLKEILANNNYFHGETQNNYFDDELKQAIIKFQIDYGIIKQANDYGAGYVGASTQNKLQNIANNTNKTTEIVNTASETTNIANNTNKSSEDNQLIIQAGTSKNSSLDDVKNLQITLNNLGYFNGHINGEYSDDLVQAILSFQKDQKIINGDNDYGAGYLGPKTKTALNQAKEQQLAKFKDYPVSKAEIWEGENTNSAIISANNNNEQFPKEKQSIYQSDLDNNSDPEAIKNYLAKKGFLEFNHTYLGSHRFKEVKMSKTEIIEEISQ